MREYDTKLAAKAKKRSYHKKKWKQIRRAIYIVFMFCVFFHSENWHVSCYSGGN